MKRVIDGLEFRKGTFALDADRLFNCVDFLLDNCYFGVYLLES